MLSDQSHGVSLRPSADQSPPSSQVPELVAPAGDRHRDPIGPTRIGGDAVARLEEAMPELKQALDLLEELSGASGEGLLGRVGEVTEKIEEITEIVEKSRPILDAAEALM